MGNDSGLIILIVVYLAVVLAIPITLTILGIGRWKRKPKQARWLLIVAALYILVGAGICGTMMR